MPRKPAGSLLILACSDRKRRVGGKVPAIHLYDGVNFRVLKARLADRGWPAGLQIKILSAKYGLIDATELIEHYDQRMVPDVARRINLRTIAALAKIPCPSSIFVNLGGDYLPAVAGLSRAFPRSTITYARGPIGMKMRAMKRWLEKVPYGTARLMGHAGTRPSYLYFFPDWDDFVYEPFTSKDGETNLGKRTYAHELCGNRVPFDGILLSLAHIHVGKGALHRISEQGEQRIYLRRRLKIPRSLLLFGDCGAFSYANESTPPFSPERAAELYERFGFDIGASVDHIPVPEIEVRQEDGSLKKTPLAQSTRYDRMYLTRDNADRFLRVCRRRGYGFAPLGVIQGLGPRSYVQRLHDYLDMGYEHIALGGLVPRSDADILEILCAVRRALQSRPRPLRRNAWIHLFGILRPKLQLMFRQLGVSSFDSASYFRKAWLRSDQNYLDPAGHHWYGTIRIPIARSIRMIEAGQSHGLTPQAMAKREAACLAAVEAWDYNPTRVQDLLKSVDRYGPLLERKGEENHFRDRHAVLLKDRPWEKCSCPFCKSAGIHVVVYRGASRNKRRGLHNTWVFYHKVLHGDAVPTSVSAEG